MSDENICNNSGGLKKKKKKRQAKTQFTTKIDGFLSFPCSPGQFVFVFWVVFVHDSLLEYNQIQGFSAMFSLLYK
jgi:hypothetical protein